MIRVPFIIRLWRRHQFENCYTYFWMKNLDSQKKSHQRNIQGIFRQKFDWHGKKICWQNPRWCCRKYFCFSLETCDSVTPPQKSSLSSSSSYSICFNHFLLQHLLRHVLENQHKLHKFLQLLQQQSVRHCSSGRLQQAVQPEIEQDYPQVKSIDASNSYYPVNQPFKHAPDVGDQFAVSQWKTFTLQLLSDIESLECNTTLITIETKCRRKNNGNTTMN